LSSHRRRFQTLMGTLTKKFGRSRSRYRSPVMKKKKAGDRNDLTPRAGRSAQVIKERRKKWSRVAGGLTEFSRFFREITGGKRLGEGVGSRLQSNVRRAGRKKNQKGRGGKARTDFGHEKRE